MADSFIHNTTSYQMFVPNFKILGQVVAEKSLTKKSLHTNTHTEKAKTIYPLYTSYTGGIKSKNYIPPIFFVYRGYNEKKGNVDFLDAQGKLTMWSLIRSGQISKSSKLWGFFHTLVRSGRISNSSELSCMSSLPASMKRIR